MTPHDASLRAEGVAFGPHPRQRLDIYAPASVRAAPVIIFWYGGGWVAGDRAQYRFAGQALAALGAVAMIADYRLHPEVRWPAFVEDGAMALAWAARHAEGFGGDPGRLFAAGHSAGGHSALVLGLDGRHLGAVGMTPRSLAGIIALAPPTGLEPYRGRQLPAIFGPGGDDSQRPIRLAAISPPPPPALLFAGAGDSIIRPEHVTALGRALGDAGGDAQVRLIPGAGHLGLLFGLAPAMPGGGGLLPEIGHFLATAPRALSL